MKIRNCLAALFGAFALPAFAQIAPPWAISGTQRLLSVSGGFYNSAALSPAGDVYVYGRMYSGGFTFPAPTVTLGDASSSAVDYISKLDSTGRTIYTVRLGGTYLIDMAFDSAANLYVAGNAAASGFFATPGAFLATAQGDRTLFCKLRAT